MKGFEPDYRHIVNAAYNREALRLPLYEHIICDEIMETALNKKFMSLANGNDRDKKEYFTNYCDFFKQMGYDTVSFEVCIGEAMPGSGCLGGHKDGVIETRADFERYPWDEIPRLYFELAAPKFKALRDSLPLGMKAVGGAGNGIFECVQEIVGYTDLCYISADDPKLYADLFAAVGSVNATIWKQLLEEYGDIFCVCRFGDDLGFKNTTLLSAQDIRTLIIPQYRKIISLVHAVKKPFLFHSCGAIFDVMDDIILQAGIDAKHSNEDQIAPFPVWVERYGDRIGNFGGIDTDAVCRLSKPVMTDYIHEVLRKSTGRGGFAFGSGNSIPNYVPYEGYFNMVNIIREYRGE